MVEASQQRTSDSRNGYIETPQLLEPTLLRAARQVYRRYQEVHLERMERPLGVVVDRFTQRGHLIFRKKPAVLMNESFIPFDTIESGLY